MGAVNSPTSRQHLDHAWMRWGGGRSIPQLRDSTQIMHGWQRPVAFALLKGMYVEGDGRPKIAYLGPYMATLERQRAGPRCCLSGESYHLRHKIRLLEAKPGGHGLWPTLLGIMRRGISPTSFLTMLYRSGLESDPPPTKHRCHYNFSTSITWDGLCDLDS